MYPQDDSTPLYLCQKIWTALGYILLKVKEKVASDRLFNYDSLNCISKTILKKSIIGVNINIQDMLLTTSPPKQGPRSNQDILQIFPLFTLWFKFIFFLFSSVVCKLSNIPTCLPPGYDRSFLIWQQRNLSLSEEIHLYTSIEC